MAVHLPHVAPGLWDHVETTVYKTEGTNFKDIIRRRLLGPEQVGATSELRYFEIAAGGYSSLEIHDHTHTVIIARGRGRAILGDRVVMVAEHDICFTGPGDAHQFLADRGALLGFYCLVSIDRDRPRIPTAQELAKLRANPLLGPVLRV